MNNKIRRRCDERPAPRRAAARVRPVYDAAWQRVARARRAADNWLCQLCLLEGRVTAGKEVDHIIPVHVRPDWRLDAANTQVLCCPCHRRKTLCDNARYGSAAQRRITEGQALARAEALRLIQPPRAGEALSVWE